MALSQRQLLAEAEHDTSYRAYLFPIVVSLIVLLFLAAPWSLEHKAHAALHGLCAQRPSHSFMLGSDRLPFDARMTGIYGGFLGAAIYLGIRRRYRAAALPSWPTCAVLALFVGAMAVDGFNSLLLDMGWRHYYEPDNRLRLLTGLMTGVALASAVFLLLGMVLWKRPRLDSRVVRGGWEPFVMMALQVPFALAVMSGWSWLYVPMTLALLGTAVAVVSAIALVVVVMARTADNSFEEPGQLHGYAVAGLLAGLAMMAVFGGGRYLLESLTNAPPLT
ncbi:MAG: hypothetical protein QOF01_2054 [Thermomicrobiales bacterium]|jgi:uncharacterized membrane protein|nr:hypothetical protein [Thermomicrobiales bacterium]